MITTGSTLRRAMQLSFYSFLFIAILAFIPSNGFSQCESSFAGSVGLRGTDTGCGNDFWFGVFDVLDINDGTAASITNLEEGDISQCLSTTEFGFQVPCNAVINSVSVTIFKRNGVAGNPKDVFDSVVHLVLPDGSLSTSNEAKTTAWMETTSGWEMSIYNGGLWGETLTPDMINDFRFGALISARTEDPTNNVENRPEIDAMQIEVCYTVTGTAYEAIIVQSVDSDASECSADTGCFTVNAIGNGTLEYSIDAGSTWQSDPMFCNLGVGTYQYSVRYVGGGCPLINQGFGSINVSSTVLQPGDALVACVADNASSQTLAINKVQPFGELFNNGVVGTDISGQIQEGMTWSRSDLGGDVFHVTVDQDYNIYTGVTSLYSLLVTNDPDVLKIDANTGTPSLLTTLPGQRGIGAIEYDTINNQLFVVNMDDGIIYSLDPNSGAINYMYDHGTPDNGDADLAPLGDRVLGMTYNPVDNRLYYAIWANDFIQNGTDNEIWSVGLDGAGNVISSTAQLEITMPHISVIPGLTGSDYSQPVSDIEFDRTGTQMLLSEVGFDSSFPRSRPHESRLLGYNLVGGSWVLNTNVPAGNSNMPYEIGAIRSGLNSRGGTDWAYGAVNSAGCPGQEDEFYVVTGDALQGTDCTQGAGCIYGLQYGPAEGSFVENSILMDIQRDNSSFAKSVFGDVDIITGPCCTFFDLSLTKQFMTSNDINPDGALGAGDDVSYVIEICNQGSENAGNVEVTDYIPAAMTLSPNDTNGWVGGPPGNVTNVIPSVLTGACEEVFIVLRIDPDFTGTTIVNVAEISSDNGDDIDSTPNSDPDDDIVGGDNVTDNSNNDEDDHDTEEISISQTFDLALILQFASSTDLDGSGGISAGDDITFNINVFNQGTLPGNNIEITNFIPPGFTLSVNDTNGWTGGTTGAVTTTIGTVPVGTAPTTLSIVLTIDPSFMGTTLTNIAEISVDDGDDIDSTPNTDSTDDTIGGNDLLDSSNGDEDDHDPEEIVINQSFDLSLTKTFDSSNDVDGNGSISPGDQVTFNIEVCNEGSLVADNVNIIDYIPTGLILDDADWNDADLDGVAEHNTPFSVPVGAGANCTVIPITFTIDASFQGSSITNVAEISTDDGDDVDSTPGNNDPTEDDQDDETINIDVDFDLALTKTFSSFVDTDNSGALSAGDDIIFTISVMNQGGLDAVNTEITDYLPSDLTLSSNDANGWTGGPSGNVVNTIALIAAGSTESVDIQVTVDPSFMGSSISNSAEITSDSGDDPDSTPGNNDPTEDDQDSADVPLTQMFDLALINQFNTFADLDGSGAISVGDDVTFTITVTNQGTLDASNVEITNFIPPGFTLSTNDTNGWTGGPGGNVTNTIASIPAGSTPATLDIVLTIDPTFLGTSLINIAEISEDNGDDIDSTPNAIATDDVVGGNDVTDGSNGDEDDHDPEEIIINQPFDLSLTKTFDSSNDVDGNGAISPGDQVTFNIEVCNDGSVDANNVSIVDYIPEGLILNDTSWNDSDGDGVAELNSTLSVAVGTSCEITPITFTIDPSFQGSSITNVAEISSDDGDDVDSTPGNNDPTEDDQDDETINIDVDFDLALTKTFSSFVDTDNSGALSAGDDIIFTISVMNQGGLDATNTEITDYLPADLTLSSNDANGWTGGPSGNVVNTITFIGAGSTESVDIQVTVDPSFMGGSISNSAEITSDSGDDPDSTPGNNDPTEDDQDSADVPLTQIFDLALINQFDTFSDADGNGSISAGDDVTFTITVTNQGTLDASNVEITNFIPPGFTLSTNDSNGWTGSPGGNVTNTIASIPAGSGPVTLDIVLTIDPTFMGTSLVNIAEISNDNGDDIDSTPNAIATDDVVGGNDVIDGSNGDEDDHDPEEILILQAFDLSLTKTYSSMNDVDGNGMISPGDGVTFDIEVCNEGTVDANSVEIIDNIPDGLLLDDSAWTEVNGIAEHNNTLSVGTGSGVNCAVVPITFTVDPSFMGSSITNVAEISSADGQDIDSTPGNNDPTEDDQDDETINIDVDYDLELTKTFSSSNDLDNSGALSGGDEVIFTITVRNQGGINANNIGVTDNLPAGLSLSPNDNNGWTGGPTGSVTNTITMIPALGSQDVDIVVTIDPNFMGTSLTNIAEITSDDGDDSDSTPGNNDPTEDDQDDETISLTPIFDLALSKTLVDFNDLDGNGSISGGDELIFAITVTNEGDLDGVDIEITDVLTGGLSLSSNDSNGWSGGPTGPVTFTIASLPANGTPVTVNLLASLDSDFMGSSLSNNAEITADNGDDIDSTPGNGDETEDDQEIVTINIDQIFDLSLIKEFVDFIDNDGSGDITPGDGLIYLITVCNQGTIDAENVFVLDHLGNGMFPNDDIWWDLDNDGIAELSTGIDIPVGQCTTIDVETVINPNFTGREIVNTAEISSDNGDDIDSTPDSNPNNDVFGGDNITDNTNNDEDDHDVAVVTVVQPTTTKLGDMVFIDCNGNGVMDPGEQGLAGVVAHLVDADGDIVASTSTDEDGKYLFENLTPGLYYVQFELPSGYEPTPPNVGSDNTIDSDVDHSNGWNSTAYYNLEPGECDLDNYDFGLYQCIEIGDLVWYDTNENDIWDSNENGINQLRVVLWREMAPGKFVAIDYTFTGHEPGTPSDDGYFKFCVAPGTYYLEFVQPPFGLVPANANRGSDEEIDSDVTHANGNGTTNTFTVRCGDQICDIGAGYYPMGTIGDLVWMDNNGNGLRDPNEEGVSQVAVNAYNTDGDMVGSAVTDNNGNYVIDYLQQDDVYLQFMPPSGFSITTPNIGSDEAMDSDVDGSNGPLTTPYYNIEPGNHTANIDAGLVFGSVPLTWVDFYGDHQGSHNALTWIVDNEINVSHYEVERRLELETEFNSVGTVLSESLSEQQVLSYHFDDYNLISDGDYLYRIKQIDNDGTYSYSDVISITVTSNTQTLANIYPNPTSAEFTFELELAADVDGLSFDAMAADGRYIEKQRLLSGDLTQGKHYFTIDVSSYTEGVYTFKFRAGNSIWTRKLIILK